MKTTSCAPFSLVCLFIATSPSYSNAQETIDYRDAATQLDLMRRPDVLAELGISKDQSDRVGAAVRKVGERFEAERSRVGIEEEERLRRSVWIEQAQLQRKVLDPGQVERLDQLRVQYQALGALGSSLAEALELTDEQKSRLAAKEEELGEELRQKMVELFQRSQIVLRQSLTPKQQAEWAILTGDRFEFESPWPGLSFLISLR